MDRYRKRVITISACICLGQILVGYCMGWTAPVLPKLLDSEQTPLDDVITPGQASWAASLLYVGTIIGPHISAYLCNVVGRRPCLQLGGVLTLLSFVMVVVTKSISMVYALRVVQGFGSGIIHVTNLIYIGEIAPTNIRGILLTCLGIFSTMGTLIIYSVGPFISYKNTGYIGMAITILYIFGLFWIPETPVFQMLRNNELKAARTLNYLGRKEDIGVLKEAKATTQSVEIQKFEWLEIFTVKSNRKAFTIVMTLGMLQQLSGAVAVIFFASTIFEAAGSSIRPALATIIIGVTQLVASSITPIFVDRIGRKILLLISTAICASSLATLGVYFYLASLEKDVINKIGWIPLVSLIVFFLSYDLGFGIIPNTLSGEMFRMNVRSRATASSSTISWLIGFGVSSAFGYVLTSLGGHFVFWFFSGACVVAFLFTQFYVPETRGKSFVEIDNLLSR